MLCSRCGALINNKDAKFCPKCGYELNSYSIPIHRRYVPAPEPAPIVQAPAHTKKNRSSMVAAVVVVLILFAGLAAAGLAFSDESTPQNSSQRTETQTITDDTYFVISGDFLQEKNTLSVSLTGDGRIAFTLSGSLASNCTSYNWTLYDHDNVASVNKLFYTPYTGEKLTKAEPVLYYLGQKSGVYDISVDCTTSSGQHTTYSGTVEYFGIVKENYSWTYKGVKYNAEVSFNYKEYLDYKNMNTRGRAVTDYSKVVNFITYDDPAIKDLVGSLREAYGVDSSDTSPEFASFILAFVQICFAYPPYSTLMSADKYQYGADDYFAYPLETILYGMGDCEDTSFLAASLFKAAGFGAGVIILPEHVVAAVGLNTYGPISYYSGQYELIKLSVKNDPRTYYACETTVDTFLNIGLVSATGSDGHPYSWYIGKQGYGLYLA